VDVNALSRKIIAASNKADCDRPLRCLTWDSSLAPRSSVTLKDIALHAKLVEVREAEDLKGMQLLAVLEEDKGHRLYEDAMVVVKKTVLG
jgi:hypothetical protein